MGDCYCHELPRGECSACTNALKALTDCPKCKRPIDTMRGWKPETAALYCNSASPECDAVADSYRRGLADGVAMAKEHAEIDYGRGYIPSADLVWTYVDAALEEATR